VITQKPATAELTKNTLPPKHPEVY